MFETLAENQSTVYQGPTGLAERRTLKAEVLIIGRYPRIPDQHRRNAVANIVAKRLPFATEFCNGETSAPPLAAPPLAECTSFATVPASGVGIGCDRGECLL